MKDATEVPFLLEDWVFVRRSVVHKKKATPKAHLEAAKTMPIQPLSQIIDPFAHTMEEIEECAVIVVEFTGVLWRHLL